MAGAGTPTWNDPLSRVAARAPAGVRVQRTGGSAVAAVEHELRPGDPASVAQGRTFVSEAMHAAPSSPADVCDDAVLAASELVTNAVAAATDRIVLRVVREDGLATVSVYDDGPGLPVVHPASPDRPHGRGLPIVEVIAARWGVSPEALGKWVWAEFPVALPAPPAATA